MLHLLFVLGRHHLPCTEQLPNRHLKLLQLSVGNSPFWFWSKPLDCATFSVQSSWLLRGMCPTGLVLLRGAI
eukprot:52503-Amphidinium_carterae.1